MSLAADSTTPVLRKRKQGHTDPPTASADAIDDDAYTEKYLMQSVLRAKGKMWTTHLAHLLADRGEFAVLETEQRRWLAVLPAGAHKWVVDNGRGVAVPNAINAAVKQLGADLAAFVPDSSDEDEVDDDCSKSSKSKSKSKSTATLKQQRFELPLEMKEQLRNKLLPGQMLEQNKMLEPKTDGVFCSDGMVVREGKAEIIKPDDYCTQTVGFASKAMLGAPAGFDEWYAQWKETPHSGVVDMVVASACLLGKPVSGEIGFGQQRMQLLMREVAGDVDVCTADSAPYTIQAVPPEGTTASMLVHAATLAKKSVLDAMQAIACGSSAKQVAVTLWDLLKLSGKAPPDVHASHILYSCLRTNQACRDSPLEHVVKLLAIKEMLKPAGNYANRNSLEKILAKTFTDPPSMIDGNLHHKVKAKGWVVQGVYAVQYMDSEVPRTWTPLPIQQPDAATAALADSEAEDRDYDDEES